MDGEDAFCADADLAYRIDISEPIDPRIIATLHVPGIVSIEARYSDLYLAGAGGLVVLKNLCARAASRIWSVPPTGRSSASFPTRRGDGGVASRASVRRPCANHDS